jgi:hypothetical protein
MEAPRPRKRSPPALIVPCPASDSQSVDTVVLQRRLSPRGVPAGKRVAWHWDRIQRGSQKMAALIERRTMSGPAIVVGNVRATPQARVVIVRLPFGGFVWNRPSCVVVERDGRVERLRIVNVTRIAHTALWASVLAALLVWRRRPRPMKGART